MKTNFETFANECKQIAKELHTIMDAKKYDRYGWASIAFMTDKFGGVYVHLHYDINNNKVVNWFGTERETEITDLQQLKELVRVERDKLLKERDMESIYEQVNNEY
jgi:hypothetical protein